MNGRRQTPMSEVCAKGIARLIRSSDAILAWMSHTPADPHGERGWQQAVWWCMRSG
jgi:hypothetical protein